MPTSQLRSLIIGIALLAAHSLAADLPPDGNGRFEGDIQVLFVSNRGAAETDEDQPAPPQPGSWLGDRRGSLQYGLCTVNFSDIPGISYLSERLPFYLPNQTRTVVEVEPLNGDVFWSQLGRGRTAQPLLGYIHGYNIDFAKACRRAAVFQSVLGLDNGLALFSWPSLGTALRYAEDETNVRWSVPHIEAFVRGLVERSPTGQVDLVAHSLGARGLLDALEHLACELHPRIPIRQLVLVAPDVDAATGAVQLPRIRPLAERITLYVANSDMPLRLSRELHGYPRLGEAGEFLQPIPGVEIIDVSDVAAYELSGHLYHLYLPPATADMRQLLATGAGADERQGLERRAIEGRPYWAVLPPAE